jgi:hypothetical protein
MTLHWRLLDKTIQDPPVYIELPDDRCFYAREYISKGGFKSSEANDLITNYKKPADRRGKPEWRYKEQAVRQFAEELAMLIGEGWLVTFIPSSKLKTDPAYDTRFEDTLLHLQQLRPDLRTAEVLHLREPMDPYHGGRTRGRHPDEIYQKIAWTGLPDDCRGVVLIDDILTTGSHFKACKRMIREKRPGMEVVGAFWAKAIWPTAPPT